MVPLSPPTVSHGVVLDRARHVVPAGRGGLRVRHAAADRLVLAHASRAAVDVRRRSPTGRRAGRHHPRRHRERDTARRRAADAHHRALVTGRVRSDAGHRAAHARALALAPAAAHAPAGAHWAPAHAEHGERQRARPRPRDRAARDEHLRAECGRGRGGRAREGAAAEPWARHPLRRGRHRARREQRRGERGQRAAAHRIPRARRAQSADGPCAQHVAPRRGAAQARRAEAPRRVQSRVARRGDWDVLRARVLRRHRCRHRRVDGYRAPRLRRVVPLCRDGVAAGILARRERGARPAAAPRAHRRGHVHAGAHFVARRARTLAVLDVLIISSSVGYPGD